MWASLLQSCVKPFFGLLGTVCKVVGWNYGAQKFEEFLTKEGMFPCLIALVGVIMYFLSMIVKYIFKRN